MSFVFTHCGEKTFIYKIPNSNKYLNICKDLSKRFFAQNL